MPSPEVGSRPCLRIQDRTHCWAGEGKTKDPGSETHSGNRRLSTGINSFQLAHPQRKLDRRAELWTSFSKKSLRQMGMKYSIRKGWYGVQSTSMRLWVPRCREQPHRPRSKSSAWALGTEEPCIMRIMASVVLVLHKEACSTLRTEPVFLCIYTERNPQMNGRQAKCDTNAP